MESQPQNPEFRINPENFYPCICRPLPGASLHIDARLWVKIRPLA